jgi:hypothetical protein
MTRVRVGRRDATTVGRLLREIGGRKGLSAGLQSDADRWASAIDRTMDSSDLERLALLLRQASAERGLASSYRDAARYWAAYLEGRIW